MVWEWYIIVAIVSFALCIISALWLILNEIMFFTDSRKWENSKIVEVISTIAIIVLCFFTLLGILLMIYYILKN